MTVLANRSIARLQILFISPYIPSLIRVRPYNFIKFLAYQGHHITLLALIPPGEETNSLAELRQWCTHVETVPLPRWRTLWNGFSALPSQTPLQAAYSRSPEMAQLIRQTCRRAKFDVAHIEHLRGAELARSFNGLPTVLDAVDSITLLFERVLASGPTLGSRVRAKLDLGRSRRYESRYLEQFERVLVTSPQDNNTLAQLATMPEQTNRLVTLPNGVDLSYFSPMDIPRDLDTLIFSGKMSYHANIAAALDLVSHTMPLIWQRLPKTRLVIAGKDPDPKVRALANHARITVTGTVPDLRPYLAQSAISIAPMRYGVGIQNKILEAMAMATPVISTSQVLNALQAQPGRDLCIADSPQAMADIVVELLQNKQQRETIGRAGRAYVESHHNWQTIAARLVSVYQSAQSKYTI